jgi:homoserine/homoserine lactone efflux protein
VLATALGIAALLATSKTAFMLVRLLGAAYLLYLGLWTLLHRRTREAADAPQPISLLPLVAMRQGLMVTLGVKLALEKR